MVLRGVPLGPWVCFDIYSVRDKNSNHFILFVQKVPNCLPSVRNFTFIAYNFNVVIYVIYGQIYRRALSTYIFFIYFVYL